MILLFELIMGLIILGAIGLFIWTLRSRHTRTLDIGYYKGQWAKVLKTLSTGEQGWRLAIIDADKLLDQALRQHGAKGETLGDRLRDREKLFSKYNDLWAAHKLRNKLVHEPQVNLSKAMAGRALQEFQRALKELGALA
ncbi:MAG TPA: hypothetical protein VLF60_04310 [Candidatus Saccharimonadales bacterium]|nr:hypothetical protein [Candidatus Saccharimonadales bacterium]